MASQSLLEQLIHIIRYHFLLLYILLFFPVSFLIFGPIKLGEDWRKADHSSAGIAPKPTLYEKAVVQVYAARLWGWRGAFGVHTWIATKRPKALHYHVYQVIGWRYYAGKTPLYIAKGIPDRKWFGNRPEVLLDLRGYSAEKLIDKIEQAAVKYPAPAYYATWPGPNSNTFTAYIARAIPELRLRLPPHAIGKDFLLGGPFRILKFFAKTPSGTGWQFSYFGLLGISVGIEEGIEFNFLGLNFGIDPLDFSLLLPGFGEIKI